MADERASLTITLTDELSPGLAAISSAFEDLEKRIASATGLATQGFRRVRQELGGTRDEHGRLTNQMQSFGVMVRTTFIESSRALATIGVGTGEVGRALGQASQAATSFGTAMSSAGKATAGFTALAAGATVGAVALAGALVRANQELTNLKLRLLESDESQIRRSKMALESIGGSLAQQQQMSNLIFDSYRGVSSEMFQALEKFGPNATRIVSRAREMFHQEGQDIVEVTQFVAREISKQAPTVQRYMWEALHIPPEIGMQWAKAQRDIPAVYKQSAEQAKVLDAQQQRLKQNYQALTTAASNLWNRVKDQVLEFVLPKLNTVLEVMLKIVRLIPGTGGAKEDSEARKKRLGDLDTLLAPREKGKGGVVPPSDAQRGAWEQERERLQREEGRYQLQQQLEERAKKMSLSGAGGGGSNMLREISMKEAEGNTTLVEIRDILTWIRNQQEAPAATGGGPPGFQRASFGGGGGGGGGYGGGFGPGGAGAPGGGFPGSATPGGGGDSGAPGGAPPPQGLGAPTSPAEAPETLEAGGLAPGAKGTPGDVRATWFSATGPEVPGWSDPSGQREGPPALEGSSTLEPGIATPGRAGLGDYYKVTAPNGTVAYVRKNDVGPGRGALARGVGADINAALAAQVYPGGQKHFQERGWRIERVGKTLPEGIKPGVQGGGAARGISLGDVNRAVRRGEGGEGRGGIDAGAEGRIEQRQGGATRNQPISPALSRALSYASATTGLKVVVHSGGQPSSGPRRTGSHRHDFGDAADFDLVDEKGNIVPHTDKRALEFVEQAGRAGVKGGGAEQGYMGPNRMHLDVVGGARGGSGGIYRGSHALRESLRRGMQNPVDQTEIDNVTKRATKRAAEDIPVPTPRAKPRGDLGSAKVDVEVKAPRGDKDPTKDKRFVDASLKQTPQMAPVGAPSENNYSMA